MKALLTLSVLALAACGGGSDSSTQPDALAAVSGQVASSAMTPEAGVQKLRALALESPDPEAYPGGGGGSTGSSGASGGTGSGSGSGDTGSANDGGGSYVNSLRGSRSVGCYPTGYFYPGRITCCGATYCTTFIPG